MSKNVNSHIFQRPARAMIPADDALFCPEELLKTVLTHVHYLPAGWKNKAHTSEVQASFDKMFQLRAIYILEELLSPFLIPYILFFKLRPKSLEIVRVAKSALNTAVFPASAV